MDIHIIWAQDRDGGIGAMNKLPWHISEDLKNFKSITLGGVVVMGRKTWESLPIKPLPKRANYVLSTREITGAESFRSYEECITHLRKHHAGHDIFVIGGASIYKLFYSTASVLHMTEISIESRDIDTFFPVPYSNILEEFKPIETRELSGEAIYRRMVRL